MKLRLRKPHWKVIFRFVKPFDVPPFVPFGLTFLMLSLAYFYIREGESILVVFYAIFMGLTNAFLAAGYVRDAFFYKD